MKYECSSVWSYGWIHS